MRKMKYYIRALGITILALISNFGLLKLLPQTLQLTVPEIIRVTLP